jgi:hypothetical protein
MSAERAERGESVYAFVACPRQKLPSAARPKVINPEGMSRRSGPVYVA